MYTIKVSKNFVIFCLFWTSFLQSLRENNPVSIPGMYCTWWWSNHLFINSKVVNSRYPNIGFTLQVQDRFWYERLGKSESTLLIPRVEPDCCESVRVSPLNVSVQEQGVRFTSISSYDCLIGVRL